MCAGRRVRVRLRLRVRVSDQNQLPQREPGGGGGGKGNLAWFTWCRAGRASYCSVRVTASAGERRG